MHSSNSKGQNLVQDIADYSSRQPLLERMVKGKICPEPVSPYKKNKIERKSRSVLFDLTPQVFRRH